MKSIPLAALLLCAASTPALADGLDADERGLTLAQGDLTLKLGGRLHFDAVVFDDPAAVPTSISDAAFRRARLELSGRAGDAVRFRIDREFAGGSKGWRNVWLGIAPTDQIELRGGNMLVPFSAEDLQSSNSIPFAERSLASSLAPGYGLGGMAIVSGKRWTAAAGWFTDALDDEDGRAAERGRGFVGRVTALPVSQGRTRLHLGLAGERRTFSSGETWRLSADPGSALAPAVMASGTLRNLRHLSGWSAELGISHGPLLVQAQTLGTAVSRDLAPSLHFNGQTVQASWLVTGRGYDYARGTGNFSGAELRKGRFAAELAVRYSRLDLRDGAFDRGIGQAITGGANLYFGKNLRLMTDFTHTKVDFSGLTPDRASNVGVARMQVNF
ncbi:OprO/OprP family phosphate-selective porin [Novosphingobium sp. B 225]|uniref:OprO/OprP family phosphate-selective porin n=1 Tax=Novosphingobium sp. B 225 TaxID=1961849 RepID=UPI001595C447|nr:porin [Novosphingobium sp. B 225]